MDPRVESIYNGMKRNMEVILGSITHSVEECEDDSQEQARMKADERN